MFPALAGMSREMRWRSLPVGHVPRESGDELAGLRRDRNVGDGPRIREGMPGP